uniref:NELL2-interacting cell ontogeny regulator 1 n=1 Tax=Oryzias latipes TaxID=8090 RepID=A0A3B3I020_ORYLA
MINKCFWGDGGSDLPAVCYFLAVVLSGRPCVDCHAFEFMQRALQDLKKTAFNLDARTETLVLRAERRALCDCMPVSSLR